MQKDYGPKRRKEKEGEETGKEGLHGGLFVALLLALVVVIAAVLLRGDEPKMTGQGVQESAYPCGDGEGKEMVNLALEAGVEVTADSVEAEQFSPSLAADGDRMESGSRWSSANETGQPSHWLCFAFDQEQEFAFVRIFWERLNVEGFVIEYSADGKDWETAALREGAPETNEQTVILDEPVRGRYLRLRTTAVSDSEENQYLYYQNVSVLEMEIYSKVPMSYGLKAPQVEVLADGGRRLKLPQVPEGYEICLAGADYEEVIGKDGTVYPTLEEKEVQVGFVISNGEIQEETPAYAVTVPALSLEEVFPEEAQAVWKEWNVDQDGMQEGQEASASEGNVRPSLSVPLAEWAGGSGSYGLEAGVRLVAEPDWEETAGQALEEARQSIQELVGEPVELVYGSMEEMEEGDIYLGIAKDGQGLGKEGSLCAIRQEGVWLYAAESQGMIWGLGTLTQLLDGKEAPCGAFRDYPRYAVRGFSVDIGRRMLSMDTLREMVEALAEHKMNTLGIHLNDNEILSTSGRNDTIQNAFGAYAGFRLESKIENEDGRKLTSEDGSFTKEEWKEFVSWAAGKGVEVVPEIDTPAHSLAITRLFPELALADEPENVDQLDLSDEETFVLAERLWTEYLEGEEPVFAAGGTVHIGMDEYYGDGSDYAAYMNRMIRLIKESGRSVRMWGSLNAVEGQVEAENVQVQIWSTMWADPEETYQAGFTVINSLNTKLYISPGGGYDYLVLDTLEGWEANVFDTGGKAQALPVWSDRMAGAIYCLWNDTIGNLEAGITEEDIYDRFFQPLSCLAGKLW